METQIDNGLNTKLSAIDKALAAAHARKAMKEGLSTDASTGEAKAPKAKVDADSKARDRMAKDAERTRKAAERDAARAAKRAAKAAAKANAKPAHMKKIERAASKLPALNNQMELLFNEATTNFSAQQITALALHLQHFNRVKATERALGQKIEAGQTVRIIGGDPKFIGQTGTITKAQRIRCYVEVPGAKKAVYLFTSDVEIAAVAKATGTHG